MNFTLNVWPYGHKDKQTASPGCHSALPSCRDSVGNSVTPFILQPFKETSVCESAHKAPQPHRYRTFLQSCSYKPPCSRKTANNLFYAVLRQFDTRSSGSVERNLMKKQRIRKALLFPHTRTAEPLWLLVRPLIWFFNAVGVQLTKGSDSCSPLFWKTAHPVHVGWLICAAHLNVKACQPPWTGMNAASSKAQEHILVDITRAFNGIIVHVWRD